MEVLPCGKRLLGEPELLATVRALHIASRHAEAPAPKHAEHNTRPAAATQRPVRGLAMGFAAAQAQPEPEAASEELTVTENAVEVRDLFSGVARPGVGFVIHRIALHTPS